MTQPVTTMNARVPGATYRVQFHAGFTFQDAIEIVPYLQTLGITHLYASPILKARPGSTHGYDVIDHSLLNPEVGTDADFVQLVTKLHEHDMGLLLDVVPNHMCVGNGNAWWQDVLEHGPSSPYADYFDIAWSDSPRPQMHGRLLLPALGDQYGTVLESGQLVPTFEAGEFVIHYHQTRLPIDPRTYGLILEPAADAVRAKFGPEHASAVEIASILHATQHLPPRGELNTDAMLEAQSEYTAIRRRLAELRDRFPEAADAVADSVGTITGVPGDPTSFVALDELLERQAYRPCFWRVASDEINYRRFFDVNDLAALNTEREDVFQAVHERCLRWAADGLVDGLRIDHPDGLFDPKQYLKRLQEAYRLAQANRGHEPGRAPPTDPLADGPTLSESLYVVVEKILGEGETLRNDWDCNGTTGYEFINALNGLFVDPAGEKLLTAFYQDFTGVVDTWTEIAYQKKRQVTQASLASELNGLAHQLDRVARLDRRSRDFTLNGIRKALREVVAQFPVYRSYIDGEAHNSDKAVVGKAIHQAYRRNPLSGKAVFDFIRDTILLKDSPSGPANEAYRELQRRFAGRFQQFTAPVTAKGVEDTAFYVYNRLGSLTEVGGDPGRFGWRPEAVHSFLADRVRGGLSPLSTHDTKRGEDMRARLNVLSELPGAWANRVAAWSERNRHHKVELHDGVLAPDANEEYFLYQTLVGAWPDDLVSNSDGDERDEKSERLRLFSPASQSVVTEPLEQFHGRIREYIRKAMSEAKVHTSWLNPDSEYESAVGVYIDRILNPTLSGAFLTDLAAFSQRVAFFGRVNSLAQTLVRCTAPGVPDTYQGTEAWDLSLVDPDNRRPVNYVTLAQWLQELDSSANSPRGLHRLALELSRRPTDPRTKMFVTAIALRCRRDNSDLFGRGGYLPLTATGDKAGHVFAFLRTLPEAAAIVLIPRLSVGLVPQADRVPIGNSVWGNTALVLPGGVGNSWRNVLTGETLDNVNGQLLVAEALGVFPVALLVRV